MTKDKCQMTKEIRMSKLEATSRLLRRFRTSDFGLLSSFGVRHSPKPHPTMTDLLFYIFAALTLIFGFLVIANPFSRNPVTSAMFLVLTIASLAGLFVLLNAFFLAAVQVLVYAGAVMVLFLFVIMLLDLKAEERRKIKSLGVVGGLISVGTILAIFVKSLHSSALGAEPIPRLEGTTVLLGKLLFRNYLLPFEIVSVILLVAMVGVVLLSKKDLK
jgi:NADH-quinone oxidoreductase subunit J